MEYITRGYIEEFLIKISNYPNSPVMNEMIQYAERNMLPILRPVAVSFLDLMVRIHKPKAILEVGTSIGYSSIIMAKAMGDKGKIITIEKDEDTANKARVYIDREGLSEQISVIIGDAGEVLHYLSDSFDLIFLDGPKGQYINYLPDCIRLLNTGGLLICDDVLYYGTVAGNELVRRRKMTIINRLNEFLVEINNNPSLITSVIPLGDGISISIKKDDNTN